MILIIHLFILGFKFYSLRNHRLKDYNFETERLIINFEYKENTF